MTHLLKILLGLPYLGLKDKSDSIIDLKKLLIGFSVNFKENHVSIAFSGMLQPQQNHKCVTKVDSLLKCLI